MSRREKSEIIKDILTLCEIPRGKTDIVYKCNLNFNIVKKYLKGCFNSGWLVEENLGFKKLYRTTELGEQVLDTLSQSVSLIHF